MDLIIKIKSNLCGKPNFKCVKNCLKTKFLTHLKIKKNKIFKEPLKNLIFSDFSATKLEIFDFGASLLHFFKLKKGNP